MIDRAFDLILKLTGVEDTLLQSEFVMRLREDMGFDPDHPPENFDGVYICTLVKYTQDESGHARPRPLLHFFRQAKIREFIRLTYDGEPVPQALQNAISDLLIGPLGQQLNSLGIDLTAELGCFEALFTDVVKRTRTPKEVWHQKQLAHQLEQMQQQIQQQNEALQAAIDQKLEQLAGSQPTALPATMADFPLVHQVKAWFNALDYGEDNYCHATEDYYEWIITIPARRGFDRILVRCVNGEASTTDVEELYDTVDVQDADEGWLVYNRRISKAAADKLTERQYRDLFSYTLDELIDQAADFTNYIDWLEKEVKVQGIDTDYVQLACKKDDIDLATQHKIGTSRYSDTEGGIEVYVDGWLEDDAKEHLSVLGEFGTGKTWFSFHYAWLALRKYQQTKEQSRKRSRLPLVIPLRDYAKALDVGNVIANFFFNKHDIRITSKMFIQLNRMGKLLLIFDGFDEMAARVDKQAMINNFWELAKVVGPGAKAILTCRTEHFPDAKQGRALLNAELQASTKKLTGEPPQFEVLELEKFNENQIRTMLANRTGEGMVEKVMGNAKLMELAERPVMVDLILDALPKIESLDQVDELNMSRVYLYAVTERLERDKRDQRTFTSLADKLYFLCEVSWEMLQTDQMSLHFTAFPERLQRLFGDKVREQRDLDHWHYDMMGQTMLVRDDEGNYRPAHRSLLEFFAGYKIVASLGVMKEDYLKIARMQSHIYVDTEPRDYTWDEYFKRQFDTRNELVLIAPLRKFRHKSFDQLEILIGENKFPKAVLDLAHSMISKETMREHLIPLIQQTRALTSSDTKYVGSNIAELMLRRDHRALEQAPLHTVRLPEVNFSRASLRWTSLQKADLRHSLLPKTLGAVHSVMFSPHGNWLAVGEINGTVQLWNTQTYQALMIKKGHVGRVNSVAFSPDGEILASGSFDKLVKLWSVSSQKELAVLTGHVGRVNSVAFSPDGEILASGSADETIKLWSVSEKNELTTLSSQGFRVNSVVFSPDGEILAGGSADGTIKLWSTTTQQELVTLSGHQLNVHSVAFSPDGEILASGSADGTIKLWSISTQQELITLSGHQLNVHSVAFSPDGEILASGSTDETVKLWSISTQQELVTLSSQESKVNSVAFSPDGEVLVSANQDRSVRFWSVSTHIEIATLLGYGGWFNSVAFSPDGKILASGNGDKSVKLWSVSTHDELATLVGHRSWIDSIVFSPDGQVFASGGADESIKLWSTSNQKEIATLIGHLGGIRSLTFSPNGKILASGSNDKTLKLWSMLSYQEVETLSGHEDWVNSVVFSPDGYLLASGSDDGNIKLWSTSHWKELVTFSEHKDWVLSVAFNSDGKILASGSADETIKLWSVLDQQELTTLSGHKGLVTSVKFSPDGRLLASGSNDGSIKLWSIDNQKELATLSTRGSWVRDVVFSPDGHLLASSNNDQTTRLWNVSTGRCITVLDDRLCAGLDITGTLGLTDAQRTTLQLLGAVDHNQQQPPP